MNAGELSRRQFHASPEWYTPPWLLQRIGAFLGEDWYDPCPASYGKPTCNGLAESWAGKRVYCNPPYGRDIVPWTRKAATEPVREIIVLVSSYTETRWFQPLWDFDAVLFTFGRLAFMRPDGREARSPYGSALVYRGRRWRKFAEAFSDLGAVVRPYARRRLPQPVLLEVVA